MQIILLRVKIRNRAVTFINTQLQLVGASYERLQLNFTVTELAQLTARYSYVASFGNRVNYVLGMIYIAIQLRSIAIQLYVANNCTSTASYMSYSQMLAVTANLCNYIYSYVRFCTVFNYTIIHLQLTSCITSYALCKLSS